MTTLPEDITPGPSQPHATVHHEALHRLHNLIATPGDDGLVIPGDTAANLAAANPTPALRQVLVESDTGLVKIGDGSTAYNDLTYVGARELDSAETDVLQSGITGTSGSPTDITGLQISFDVVARPVKVVFEHPYLVSVTAAATPFVRIRNVSDGATIADANTAHSTAAGQFFSGG